MYTQIGGLKNHQNYQSSAFHMERYHPVPMEAHMFHPVLLIGSPSNGCSHPSHSTIPAWSMARCQHAIAAIAQLFHPWANRSVALGTQKHFCGCRCKECSTPKAHGLMTNDVHRCLSLFRSCTHSYLPCMICLKLPTGICEEHHHQAASWVN